MSCNEAPAPDPCENQPLSIQKINDYHPDNFFYKSLPNNVTVKENSEQIINALVTETGSNCRVSVKAFAEKVYYTDSNTPKRTLYSRICNYNNQKEKLTNVPIPNGANQASGTDEQVTFVDTENNLLYNFQSYSSPASPCPNLFGCFQYSGISVVPISNTAVTMYGTNPASGFGGAGILGISGAIWPEELNNGYINHALRGGYNLINSEFVSPAIKSDGPSFHENSLPMGTLLQLNPNLNLDTIDMSNSERAIAKAMQEFGIYISDTNGGGLSVKGISIDSYVCNPYDDYKSGSYVGDEYCPGHGYTAGKIPLNNIPLDQLRVIDFPHTFSITNDVRTVTLVPCWQSCS